jgi:HSP20 family protein
MADLVRTGGNAQRSLGDMLGWDPFRNFFAGASGAFGGIEVNRSEAGGYTVEIPVAGYKPHEIDVTLEDGVLTVSGKSEKRQFTRSLLLPDEIDGENIEAKVEHGLLTLTLNVHPKAQPKKITVNYQQ